MSANLEARVIELEHAVSVLKKAAEKPVCSPWQQIDRAVEAEFGLGCAYISESRSAACSLARQLAAVIAQDRFGMTAPEIAFHLVRTRSAVSVMLRTIRGRISVDPAIAARHARMLAQMEVGK